MSSFQLVSTVISISSNNFRMRKVGRVTIKIDLPSSILTCPDFPHILKLICMLQLHVIFWYLVNILPFKRKLKIKCNIHLFIIHPLQNQNFFKVTDLATKIKSPIWLSRFEINWSAGKIRSPRVSGRVLTYTLGLWCLVKKCNTKQTGND